MLIIQKTLTVRQIYVTKRVYEEWGGTKDMKDLTVEDVAPIYYKNYWNRDPNLTTFLPVLTFAFLILG